MGDYVLEKYKDNFYITFTSTRVWNIGTYVGDTKGKITANVKYLVLRGAFDDLLVLRKNGNMMNRIPIKKKDLYDFLCNKGEEVVSRPRGS